MATPLVVLDAHVVVSALIAPGGAPAHVVQMWRDGAFDLAVSVAIVAEIERVVHYPKIRKRYALPEDQVRTILDTLAGYAADVAHLDDIDVLAEDPTDRRYLECALATGARFIVSGDEHLLRLRRYRGVEILAPATFLTVMQAGL